MKNPYSKERKSNFYSALVIAFIPVIYGLYQIATILFIHQPYMLGGTNPQVVLYDTVYSVTTSDGEAQLKVARGNRVRDNRSIAVHLFEICRRFSDEHCADIESLIHLDGLEVETFFFKNDEAAFVLPMDSPEEIKQVCWGKILSYLVLSIPFFLILMYYQLLKLYYRYWYLPRYGDETDPDC